MKHDPRQPATVFSSVGRRHGRTALMIQAITSERAANPSVRIYHSTSDGAIEADSRQIFTTAKTNFQPRK